MKTVRVIAGRLGSRKLRISNTPKLRVTRQVVREAIFSSINFDLLEASFLDLFGGSGINGIEAYSRGASRVLINEVDYRLCQDIKQNLSTLKVSDVEVVCFDARMLLISLTKKFDYIFMDPPYEEVQLLDECIMSIFNNKLLTPKGKLLIETNLLQLSPNRFTTQKTFCFGLTYVHVLSYLPENLDTEFSSRD